MFVSAEVRIHRGVARRAPGVRRSAIGVGLQPISSQSKLRQDIRDHLKEMHKIVSTKADDLKGVMAANGAAASVGGLDVSAMIAEKMKSLEQVGDRAMGKVPAQKPTDEDEDPLIRNLKEVQKIMGGRPISDIDKFKNNSPQHYLKELERAHGTALNAASPKSAADTLQTKQERLAKMAEHIKFAAAALADEQREAQSRHGAS